MPADRLVRRGKAPSPGIVHLGLGAFFRAHGAIYTEQAIAASGGDWGIIGVSLRSPATRDALEPQGGCYTALERAPGGPTARRVDVVRQVLVAPEDPEAVLRVMADPAIRIVTLTVTEKGYCRDPATGALTLDHPDIAHDIADPLPRSAPGVLVRALQRRRAAGIAPFTVLSCDNLPRNGHVTRGVVTALARAIDPALADWMDETVRFPASMVDRIVPATRPEDIATVERLTGLRDAAPVVHEPFRQWVIEDDFPAGRPDWGAAGAELVADVTPYERMKLRMLNGTHSALAYLGQLAGHETIADTMADPLFRRFVRHLWQAEIIPALTPPPGLSLTAYADALLERYSNPGIRHLTAQIAMDGSQKLPQRIIDTIVANTEAGRDSAGLLLAVAGWMIHVGGTDLSGAPIDLRDPLADRLRACVKDATTTPARVAALLSLRTIFPPAFAATASAPLVNWMDTLRDRGVAFAIEKVLT